MSGIYITAELAELLGQAEYTIYRHLTGCVLCGSARPCDERDRAEEVFTRYGLLPRRMPGLTRRPLPKEWEV